MKHILKQTLLTGLGLALLAVPTLAGGTKSVTKTMSGFMYKLTTPDPLQMGEQTLHLQVSRGNQGAKGVQLTAMATMDDGMKSPVKVTAKANGMVELKTKFSMGGEWQLTLQQSAPVKATVTFDLVVLGGHHM